MSIHRRNTPRSPIGVSARTAPIEALEQRRLLSAAAAAAIPPVSALQGSAAGSIDLSGYFSGVDLPADAYDFNTTLGTIPVQLTPSVTPLTVANFLTYVNSGAYNGTFVHRSVPGFIWQTGGYTFDATAGVTTIPANAAVQNEPGQSNVRGTIALAKLGSDPNSGTDEFFFNLADNSQNLDNQNGGFTVFGHVLTDAGLSVMDAVAAVPTIDAGSPFDALPVRNYTTGATITADNLIEINTIVPAFSATSSNPAVATVSVSGSTLTYTPVGTGATNITVTGSALDGSTVTQTFQLTTSALAATLGGTAGVRTARFIDNNGTSGTISYRGPGAATLNFVGTGVTDVLSGGSLLVTGTNLALSNLDVTGSTAATSISINARGGTYRVLVLNGFSSDSSIGSFNAPFVDLLGQTYVNGTINNLTADYVESGSLSASAIGRLHVFGDLTSDVDVTHTLASLTVGGTLQSTVTAAAAGTVTAKAISSSTIKLSDTGVSLNRLVAATMTSSTVAAAGSIAALIVPGGLSSSQIYAGVDPTDPTAAAAAASAADIFTARIGAGNTGNAFADSTLAAGTLRTAAFGNLVDTTSTATFYGIDAGDVVNLSGFVGGDRFSLRRVSTQPAANAQLAKSGIALTNLILAVGAAST